jgi:hypothetical protein
MKLLSLRTICPLWITVILAIFVGCGGGSTKINPMTAQGLIDPSGNWKMSFTDSNPNDLFILSGLFSQVGANVSGINFSEVGNQAPGFQCAAQRDISLSNGLVSNVSTFTGTLTGNFGTITFTSTLNDAGTHSQGTYTVTPGAAGNCLGVALTGTFTGDEVPSMSGNWSGSITCTQSCPTGSTTGTLTMTLTQDDATGAVTGTYATSGIAGISSGNLIPDPLNNNLLSGSSIQARLGDNSGSILVMVGGPLNSFGTAGVGLDRSFHGNILALDGTLQTEYAVSISH